MSLVSPKLCRTCQSVATVAHLFFILLANQALPNQAWKSIRIFDLGYAWCLGQGLEIRNVWLVYNQCQGSNQEFSVLSKDTRGQEKVGSELPVLFQGQAGSARVNHQRVTFCVVIDLELKWWIRAFLILVRKRTVLFFPKWCSWRPRQMK